MNAARFPGDYRAIMLAVPPGADPKHLDAWLRVTQDHLSGYLVEYSFDGTTWAGWSYTLAQMPFLDLAKVRLFACGPYAVTTPIRFDQFDVLVIPEPTTVGLLAAGLAALASRRRRSWAPARR
jgi:hypothetical protein